MTIRAARGAVVTMCNARPPRPPAQTAGSRPAPAVVCGHGSDAGSTLGAAFRLLKLRCGRAPTSHSASVPAPRLRAAPHQVPSQGIRVLEDHVLQTACCVARGHSLLLFPITTVEDMTIVTHSDGVMLLTGHPNLGYGGQKFSASRAQQLIQSIFGLSEPLVFTAGWLYDRVVRVLAASLPFLARAQLVLRTPQDRMNAHARQPGFYFVTLAAITGCLVCDGVCPRG